MKRKVLTEVFNFELLKQIAPEIADLADEVYDRMEEHRGLSSYNLIEPAT